MQKLALKIKINVSVIVNLGKKDIYFFAYTKFNSAIN